MADARTYNQVKTDIPFARDDANRFLPWIIACVMCLTALILSAAVSIDQVIAHSRQTYLDSFHVQIPYQDKANPETAKRVMADLRSIEGIVDVALVDDEKLKALIKPWLGERVSVAQLPMPTLIEARVNYAGLKGKVVNFSALQTRLEKIAPGIAVDSHATWVSQFDRFARTTQWIAIGLGVLLLTTLMAIIVLTSRTSLKLHFKTVNILHTFGAEDEYIIRQFQWNGLWLAFKGALAGTAVALLIVLALQVMVGRLESPVLPSIDITWNHVLLFMALPSSAALVALLFTRLTVRGLLHKMH